MSIKKRFRLTRFRKYIERTNLIIFIVIIVCLAIPLTTDLIQQPQLFKKQASNGDVCTTPLAIPSYETNSLEFSHPPLCAKAEMQEIGGKLSECGDYYVGWWCSPKTKTKQTDVIMSCRGWASPLTSAYKVHFRNRVIFVRDGLLENLLVNKSYTEDEARKIVWNFLMGDIKSGNTTFGQQNPEADIEYASQQILGKAWLEAQDENKKLNCISNAWDNLCRRGEQVRLELKCSENSVCSTFPESYPPGSLPSYTCVKK